MALFKPFAPKTLHHQGIPRSLRSRNSIVRAMSSRFIQPEQYKERVSDMFQRRAEKYDENDAFHPKIAENVLRLGVVESDNVVLDVATGTGLIAISAAKFLERSGRVVALDISSAMISKVAITT